jgi:hypothetical protein
MGPDPYILKCRMARIRTLIKIVQFYIWLDFCVLGRTGRYIRYLPEVHKGTLPVRGCKFSEYIRTLKFKLTFSLRMSSL